MRFGNYGFRGNIENSLKIYISVTKLILPNNFNFMNTNRRFKAGLFFGIGMTFFYTLKIFLKNDLKSASEIINAIVVGIIGGVIAGILFVLIGWSLSLLRKPRLNIETGSFEMNPSETLVFETAANHFKGFKTLGGRLFMTNNRLIFNNHKSNGENPEFSINLNEIKSVNRYKILGIVNKGLSIVTTLETTEKFEVLRVEEWVKLLINK